MNMPEVVVIDYGLGNLLSVQRALEHCGAKVILTSDPKKILSASHVVLPGVGAFFNAMQALDDLGLVVVIRKLTQIKTPLLGICLGMQLLLEESSEFGLTSGLGLIPGRVIALPDKTYALNSGIIISKPGYETLVFNTRFIAGQIKSLHIKLQAVDKKNVLKSDSN